MIGLYSLALTFWGHRLYALQVALAGGVICAIPVGIVKGVETGSPETAFAAAIVGFLIGFIVSWPLYKVGAALLVSSTAGLIGWLAGSAIGGDTFGSLSAIVAFSAGLVVTVRYFRAAVVAMTAAQAGVAVFFTAWGPDFGWILQIRHPSGLTQIPGRLVHMIASQATGIVACVLSYVAFALLLRWWLHGRSDLPSRRHALLLRDLGLAACLLGLGFSPVSWPLGIIGLCIVLLKAEGWLGRPLDGVGARFATLLVALTVIAPLANMSTTFLHTLAWPKLAWGGTWLAAGHAYANGTGGVQFSDLAGTLVFAFGLSPLVGALLWQRIDNVISRSASPAGAPHEAATTQHSAAGQILRADEAGGLASSPTANALA